MKDSARTDNICDRKKIYLTTLMVLLKFKLFSTYLGVSSVCRVETGFTVCLAECIPRPSWTLTTKVTIEVASENTTYAIQSNRVHTGVKKTEKKNAVNT